MRITVVGAGVIGLTCAVTLEESGHEVRIVATHVGGGETLATTSDIAGAVWFPYRAGPPEAVARWAATARRWLESIAGDAAAGVDVLEAYEIDAASASTSTSTIPRPWWAEDLDVELAPAPVVGAPMAWKFRAPRAEPAIHLAWLRARLRAVIETRTVTNLDDEPGDIVVNCTGLGARTLVGDAAIAPLFGQVVVAAPNTVDLRTTITDDRDPDAVFYVIPRRDTLVLGGCAIARDALAPDPAITDRIVARARALGFAIGDVRAVRTGLRPFRNHVRVERAGRIIHCYGHGGAGFTLARGCAEEVAALIPA